eukprot:4170185-Prymnesium_polylepis.1
MTRPAHVRLLLALACLLASSLAGHWRIDGCGGAPLVECVANSETAAVRCCDTDGNSACAPHPDDSVCSPLTGSFDPALATHDEAETECRQRGRRLCRADELRASVCCGTGCGYNANLVWSSTLCPSPEPPASPPQMPALASP